jgi:hypothetical protein
MAGLPTFTYTTLAANEIRLLSPVVVQDHIIGWSLSTAHLDSGIKFEALSYVWGYQDLDESFPVICNDEVLHVRHNLHTALPYLARRDGAGKVLPIWIDAICINQNDEEEKMVQIRLMNKIYQRAHMVWIWFGIAEDQDRILEAISVLPRMKELNERETCPEDVNSTTAASVEPFRLDPPVQRAVMHLVANAWYRRLWVTQEISLAAHAIALCGEYTISLDLLHGAQWPRTRGRRNSDLELSPYEVNQIWLSSLIFSAVVPARGLKEAKSAEEVATALLRIARSTEYQHCLQPQDRIFGILGLVDWQRIENAGVDFYSYPSAPELYTEFSAFLLTNALYYPETSIHDIWRWLYNASTPEKDGRLPSWCCDLHHLVYRADRLSVVWHAKSAKRRYHASKRPKNIQRGFYSDELNIRGSLLDEISCVSDTWGTAFPTTFGQVLQCQYDIARLDEHTARMLTSDTGESLHNYCHTLVGGQTLCNDGTGPYEMRQQFRDAIEEWKQRLEDFQITKR